MTAIDDKQRQIPWVGNPKDEGAGADEGPLPDHRGRVRDFDNASIYWTPETGAHEVHGAIRDKFAQLGGTKWIGYPKTDETGCPDGIGRFNHFEHASIYWTPDTGAHEVHGAILGKWADMGWERDLGYPVTDEHDIPGGRASGFQRGEISWTPQGGPVVHRSTRFDDD